MSTAVTSRSEELDRSLKKKSNPKNTYASISFLVWGSIMSRKCLSRHLHFDSNCEKKNHINLNFFFNWNFKYPDRKIFFLKISKNETLSAKYDFIERMSSISILEKTLELEIFRLKKNVQRKKGPGFQNFPIKIVSPQ